MHARPYNNIRANVRPFADLGAGIDDRGSVNARSVVWRLIEEPQRSRKRQIGVLDAQSGCGNLLKLRLHQHGCGMRLARQRCVFRVRHKGDLRGSSLFNPFYACHFELRVSAQLSSQPACQFA